MIGCVAQAALDYDAGVLSPPLRAREIEENLWRAIRHGLDGRMIDFRSGTEIPTSQAVEDLIGWTAPARQRLGIELGGFGPNGAQRSRSMVEGGATIADAYRSAVELTAATYPRRDRH